MGTRSIIVVTGRRTAYPHVNKNIMSIRLYKHYDGYPTHVLYVLLGAIKRANELLLSQTFYHNYSVSCLAGLIVAQSIGPNGPTMKYDPEPDPGNPFGSQGDLEWVYHLNIEKKELAVYSNFIGTPAELMKNGPVDPRCYAGQLIESAQKVSLAAISVAMDQIVDEGWEFILPGKHS